jgi:uncharacterized membrane protein YwzB
MELIILILIISVIVYFYKKKRKKKKVYQIVSRVQNKENDNFEGWFYDEVQNYVPINKTFKIKYKDGNGNTTKREIYINKYGKASFGGFILAHCFLRDENRTFRADRVLECIDCETGEYIKDVSKYLQEIYFNSQEYKDFVEQQKKKEEKEIANNYIDEFLNKYDNLLKILVYVVRCDGTYNSREKAIIKELFEKLEDGQELLTDKMLHKVLLDYTLPSIELFKINVDKFIKENKYPQLNLINIVHNIISTQKSIHSNEQEILEYFEKKFDIQDIHEEPGVNTLLCPYCNSSYVHKKDKRIFKNHTNQRYQCQECKKIFSLKVEDV